jgi:hypothetical protein
VFLWHLKTLFARSEFQSLLLTCIMAGTPVLNAQALAQIADLRDALERAKANFAAGDSSLPDDGECDRDATDASSGGTARPRDETNDDDELSTRTMGDPNGPYTLEEGRAFKRHKNLSGQSDIDTDIFLKARHIISYNIYSDQQFRQPIPCGICFS